MFKVISLSSQEPSNAHTAGSPFASDCRVDVQIPAVKRGIPRTASEWTALVKIASGEPNISTAHCTRLVQLGLVEHKAGIPALTQHGRLTLGLPE